MKKWMGMSIGLALVMALSALPPSCRIQNTPTTDPSATIATSEISTVPETTPVETTIESTPEETTVETTMPIETTVETTLETTAPTSATAPTGTTGPTAVPGTPTPTPAVEETPESKTVYAKGTTNIRSGPDTSYSKVRTVSAGTALTVIARTANNWYRLSDNTYVSITVVTDTMPTPTPTPDPDATPTPAGISASAATSIAKGIVTSVRSANGLTTNFAPELCNQCYKYAKTCSLYHRGHNGSYESLAGVAQSALYVDEHGFNWSGWTCTTHSGEVKVFDTSEECLRFIVRELIVNHVPDMATSAEMTEFGVGIYRNLCGPEWYFQTEYYIYISCTDPAGLAYQIEQGWYD